MTRTSPGSTEAAPTKEDFAKWSRVWHDTCETMTTLLGLPGGGSPQEMLAQVQAYVRTAAPAQGTPQGWKLVPIEPTQEMIGAAEDAREAYAGYAFRDVYAEMVNAAPASPLPSTGLPAPAPHAEVREAQTQEYVLRAMAGNYADGNSWDHLDRETCIKAADEIKRLRFRLDYMEAKYGKIAWDATAPQQDGVGK